MLDAATATQMKADHEAVRQLAIQIGVRPAARKLGLNEDRVCQWSKREQWFSVPGSRQGEVSTVSKPGDVLLETIAANGSATKLGLSEYAKRQAQHLATKGKLKDSIHFRNLASGSATVHGWNEQGQAKQFSLNVLNLGELQIGKLDSVDAVAHPMEVVEGLETNQPTD